MSTRTLVHFSVTGEYITDQARELWLCGKYRVAMNILECLIGSTQQQRIDIIEGRAKLTGVNNVKLEPDNWELPEGYVTYQEMWELAECGLELHQRREEEAVGYARQIAALGSRTKTEESRDEEASLIRLVNKLVGKEKGAKLIANAVAEEIENNEHRHGMSLAKVSRGAYVADDEAAENADYILERAAFVARFQMKQAMREAGFDTDALASPSAMVNRGYDIVPKVDTACESINGWVLPNGNFYGCGAMEHTGLAAKKSKKKKKSKATSHE